MGIIVCIQIFDKSFRSIKRDFSSFEGKRGSFISEIEISIFVSSNISQLQHRVCVVVVAGVECLGF